MPSPPPDHRPAYRHRTLTQTLESDPIPAINRRLLQCPLQVHTPVGRLPTVGAAQSRIVARRARRIVPIGGRTLIDQDTLKAVRTRAFPGQGRAGEGTAEELFRDLLCASKAMLRLRSPDGATKRTCATHPQGRPAARLPCAKAAAETAGGCFPINAASPGRSLAGKRAPTRFRYSGSGAVQQEGFVRESSDRISLSLWQVERAGVRDRYPQGEDTAPGGNGHRGRGRGRALVLEPGLQGVAPPNFHRQNIQRLAERETDLEEGAFSITEKTNGCSRTRPGD
jgi:hypothetical protein